MPTPNPPSDIWNKVVDQPIKQDASYRLNSTDRSYIDSQILGTQTLALAAYNQSLSATGFFELTQVCTAGGTINSTASAGNGIIFLTGTPSAGFTYVLPTSGPGSYQIVNNTGQTVTVKASGSSTVLIQLGLNANVSTDGVNVYETALAGASTQGTIPLSNGLNSNVATGGQSSVRFGSYTGAVILGGILPSTAPTPGQTYDLTFLVAEPVTIRNLDASSSPGNRIFTGTGGDVLLPPGQTPQCRLVWDATADHFILQASGVQQQCEDNVLNFGFDPTGTNPNDAAIATLAAIIAATLGSSATLAGGTYKIFFPYGTYLFNSPWPTTFPNNGILFEGSSFGGQTTLTYSGVGTFIAAPSSCQFKNFLVVASTTLNAASPSLANVILALSSGAGGVYEVQTATNHGYVTGDQVGIYGTGTTADCDPALPWTITVLDATHYTLNGSTYASGYTVASSAVNAASDAAGGPSHPIVVGTTAPHGLLSGQLCFISGVTGNAAANGLMRVFGVPGTATSLPIAINLFNNVQAGSGVYVSGGTVKSGGCCLLYSRIALVAIAVQGAGFGNCHFDRVFFENWKYDLSLDGAELCWAERCYFISNLASTGYTCDMLNNDGPHSSAGVRIGGFVTVTPGVANGNGLLECNFEQHYAGVYHHDSNGHYVTRCNFENLVEALIGNATEIVYEQCANDGSNDQVGLFQVATSSAGPIALYDCGFTSSACPCVAINGADTLNGLVLGDLSFDSTFAAVTGAVQPFVWYGFNNSFNGPIGNVVALENAASGQGIFTGGKTINHSYPSAAALDLGYFNSQGVSPANFPAILIRDPAQNIPYFSKTWFPVSTFFQGYTNEVTDVPGTTGNVSYARHAEGLGWAGLVPSTGAAIGNTPLITNAFGGGEIVMKVSATDTTTSKLSTWTVRQTYYGNGGAATLGPVFEIETNDAIGLAAPTMSLTGSAGAQSVVCNVFNGAANNVFFSADFWLDGVGG